MNTEILQEWATERGRHHALIGVLCDIELGTLASEIEVIKVKPTMSTIL